MDRRFNAKKAAQIAAKLLLFESNATMSRLRLVKLLYIADRRCLKETGRLLVGDRAVAMDNGPVHSTVYSMIKGDSIHDGQWSKYIRRSGPRDVHLHHPPGNSELSRYEIDLIQRVSEDHMAYDEYDLVWMTHQFPEYKKADAARARGSSAPIPVDDIIDGVNRSDNKEDILQDMADAAAFDALFGHLR